MATHSSIFAWKTPWTEEPGRLQSMGLQRVGSLEKTLMLGGIGVSKKRGQEDEMAGWHHQLDGHESEWTLGVGDGRGGVACCSSWGHKESDTTGRLNWTELNWSDWASLVAYMVNNLPAMHRPGFDPPKKGMATHSSIFAWKIPWTGEPGRLQSMGSERVGHDWTVNTFTFL